MSNETNGSNVAMQVPGLDIQTLEVLVIGDAPLLMHAISQKAVDSVRGDNAKDPKLGKKKVDPWTEFTGALYPLDPEDHVKAIAKKRLSNKGYGLPSQAFRKAINKAAHKDRGVARVMMIGALQIIPDVHYQGKMLTQIHGTPEMCESLNRNASGNMVLAYKGMVFPWHAKITMRYDVNDVTAKQILFVLSKAGFSVGVGSGRIELQNVYGTFHVANEEELKQLKL